MFLYLSKVVPLLLYPLGLASIFVLASVSERRRGAWAATFGIVALALLLVFSNGWVAGWLASTLEWRLLAQGDLPQADAIVLLGGGTRARSIAHDDRGQRGGGPAVSCRAPLS